jgi:hypothetical protein
VFDNETKLYFAVVPMRILLVIALAAGSISSFAIVCGLPVGLAINNDDPYKADTAVPLSQASRLLFLY